MLETVAARTPAEAALAAERLKFPVVVKLASKTIMHKTEVGGVVLGIDSAKGVMSAFRDIEKRLASIGRQDEMQGVTVQPMLEEGLEAIVGMISDTQFGPLIMFGMGGIYAEVLKDRAIRLHPLTDLDARELVQSVKISRLLEGYRGSPPSDTEAIYDLLLRLSEMITDIPQIAELDFNPVKVLPQGQGYWIADARIMLS
jgi:acyl-CoA synthetase (NDP forming)